jgi:hypothetical protein
MKLDDLDAKMRRFETAHDYCVLPGVFIVARIDGRSFTRLTRDVHTFEAPYDIRFRDYMIGTVEHLMICGFRVVYGYTQSDDGDSSSCAGGTRIADEERTTRVSFESVSLRFIRHGRLPPLSRLGRPQLGEGPVSGHSPPLWSRWARRDASLGRRTGWTPC